MAVFYHVTVTEFFNNLSSSCNCAVDLRKSVTMQSILKKSVTASLPTEFYSKLLILKKSVTLMLLESG